MDIDPRQRPTRPYNAPDSAWWTNPVTVVAVVVAIFVLCSSVVVLYQNYRERQAAAAFAEGMNSFARTLEASNPKPYVVHQRPAPQVRKEWMPPRPADVCLKVTGGEINSEFQRCRQGYWVQYTVRN